MAYTVPTTRAEGDVITSANWNTDVVENIKAIYALFNNPTPTGAVISYAGATAPTGWLFAYGQAVSRTTYAALFTALGTIYGVGDGSTTFDLPDLRGRFPLGKDNMGGVSANRVNATQADNLGQGTGEEKHQLTTGELPAHTHTVATSVKDLGGFTHTGSQAVVNDTTSTVTTSSAGLDLSHNNMPPYITLNYIIKI